MKSIFHFKRDLRIDDNRALFEAIQKSSYILCVFVLDPQFLEKCPKNDPRLGFLKDALERLDEKLKQHGAKGLTVLHGKTDEVMEILQKKYGFEAYFSAESISLEGKARDEQIKEIFGENRFFQTNDTLLVESDKIETRKVFSAFYRQWDKLSKLVPIKKMPAFEGIKIEESVPIQTVFDAHISSSKNVYWPVQNADHFSNFFSFQFEHYEETRNLVYDPFSTSKISPYLRFGLVSVREVFEALSQMPFDTLIYQKELSWREFWVHIQKRFPETVRLEFQEKRRLVMWDKNEEFLEKWKNGETGYPIIDAAMRQLNRENWMHNRARMFTASFLTKNLHIDWREGEKYFAEKLLDYDDPINIGNWQWSASVGADPKPLRIFSPILQAQRFDPNAEYIKKYIPELAGIEAKKLHDPQKYALDYCAPIVDAKEEAKIAKQRFFESAQLAGGAMQMGF
jgi:deoxyribodipyrimidine photo-lyase